MTVLTYNLDASEESSRIFHPTVAAKPARIVSVKDNKFTQTSGNIAITHNISGDSAKKIIFKESVSDALTMNYNYYTNTIKTTGKNCKEEITSFDISDGKTWTAKQSGVSHTLSLDGSVGCGWENIEAGSQKHSEVAGVASAGGAYVARKALGFGNLFVSGDCRTTMNPLSIVEDSGVQIGYKFGNSDNNLSIGIGAESYDKSTPVYNQSFKKFGLVADGKSKFELADGINFNIQCSAGYGEVSDYSSSNYVFPVHNGLSFKVGAALSAKVAENTVWATGVDINYNALGQNWNEAYTMLQYNDGRFSGMLKASTTTDTTDTKRKNTISLGSSYLF